MPDEVVSFSEDLEKRVKQEFGDEATPEFMNMLRAGKAAFEHGYHNFIPKKNFLRWVSIMYNAGKEQMKVMRGKSHGKVLIGSVDVLNAGGYLLSFGKRKGFLSMSSTEAKIY